MRGFASRIVLSLALAAGLVAAAAAGVGTEHAKFKTVKTFFVGLHENSSGEPRRPAAVRKSLEWGQFSGLRAANGAPIVVEAMQARKGGGRAVFVKAADDPRGEGAAAFDVVFRAEGARAYVGDDPVPVRSLSDGTCAVSVQPHVGVLVVAPPVKPYFEIGEMPDLIACLPPPPTEGSAAFEYDMARYRQAKARRSDPACVARVISDAVWTLDALFAAFEEAFGLAVTMEDTPEIWRLVETGTCTTDPMRFPPKEHYARKRPFVYFNEPPLSPEDAQWASEGSYPSGHTIRSWCAALLLAEVNPARADKIYKRAWEYGDNRVIAGAHWQSDIDVTRVAASIGYSRLQTSPAFRAQMERAKAEFAAKTALRPTGGRD